MKAFVVKSRKRFWSTDGKEYNWSAWKRVEFAETVAEAKVVMKLAARMASRWMEWEFKVFRTKAA